MKTRINTNDPPAPFSAAGADRLMTREEVEADLGLSRRFLEIAAWRGEGPAMVKIGRRAVRYRRGDVLDWIESRRVVPSGTEAA